MTLVERLRGTATDAEANPKGYDCYDAERLATFLREAADAIEKAEAAVRYCESHHNATDRTSTQPVIYVTHCSASWCGLPIEPKDLCEVGVSQRRGNGSSTVPFHRACYAQIGTPEHPGTAEVYK